MTYLVPKRVFLTRGVGFSKERLASFEQALRDAGISHLNLVEVSSILPPDCKVISKRKGLEEFRPGEIVFCVLGKNQSNENRRMVAASVGLAVPANKKDYGYLSEHHSFGETREEAGDYAEDLAASMLAQSLGEEFDVDADWDEKKEIFRISGKIIRTRNITQTAVCRKNGWTTVLAAAIFVL
jgi:arginine decarboxylase